jgi:hypothetical protein
MNQTNEFGHTLLCYLNPTIDNSIHIERENKLFVVVLKSNHSDSINLERANMH